MNIDKIKKALEVGIRMRASQREFFKTKDRGALQESKRLEKQFDALAAEALADNSDLFVEKGNTDDGRHLD